MVTMSMSNSVATAGSSTSVSTVKEKTMMTAASTNNGTASNTPTSTISMGMKAVHRAQGMNGDHVGVFQCSHFKTKHHNHSLNFINKEF